MITRRQWMGLTLGASALGLELDAAFPVPRKAPELVVTLNGGEQLLLSSLRGKVVALAFVLTTCPHCKRACSHFQKLQEEFGARGFQVLAGAINDNAQFLVPGFIHELGLTFPVGVTQREMAYDFLGFNPNDPASGPLLMPQVVFIDRKGIARAYYPGDADFFKEPAAESNMRNEIESLLKASSAPNSAALKPASKK